MMPELSGFVREIRCNPHFSYILEIHETTTKVAPGFREHNSSRAHPSFHQNSRSIQVIKEGSV
jgi:hypothetical protein